MAREPHSEAIISAVVAELETQSDRGAGIIAAAFTEEILELVILNRLRPLSREKYDDIFKGNSPLSTFSAKIDMAYAIGIINDVAHVQLHIIRKVRNCFAHSIQPLDFEHPEIKQLIQCNELIARSGLLKISRTRDAFLWALRVTAIGLVFWRDSRVSLKLAHDEYPEIAASVRQYFNDHFTQAEAKALAQAPPAEDGGGQQSQPPPDDKSGL